MVSILSSARVAMRSLRAAMKPDRKLADKVFENVPIDITLFNWSSVANLLAAPIGRSANGSSSTITRLDRVATLSTACATGRVIEPPVGLWPSDLFRESVALHPKADAIMAPSGLVKDPVSAISLGLALIFGTAGLPHILMRFFTASDAREAR
ncbi:hypothetical protein ABIB99_001393 [Bradyrhizobium sp. LA6.1]